MAYKPPSMNIPINVIFCEVVLCKRQIYGTGSNRSAISVAMLGIELPRKACLGLTHFAGIALFQNPETGTHWNTVASILQPTGQRSTAWTSDTTYNGDFAADCDSS